MFLHLCLMAGSHCAARHPSLTDINSPCDTFVAWWVDVFWNGHCLSHSFTKCDHGF